MFLIEIRKEYYIDAEKIVSLYKNTEGLWELTTADGGQYEVSKEYAEFFINHIEDAIR